MKRIVHPARFRILCFLLAGFLALAYFPAPVGCAEGPETDAAIEGDGGESYFDGDALDGSFDENENGDESETGSNVNTETASASEGEDNSEAKQEGGAEPETDSTPEAGSPMGFGLGGIGGGQEPSGEYDIYKFPIDDYLNTHLLEKDGDPRNLPLQTIAYGFYGRFDSVECEIRWRYDDFDSGTPGRYVLMGDIVVPEGYTCSCEPVTECTVIIYDPDGPPAVMAAWVANPLGTVANRVVPLGISGEELEGFFRNNARIATGDPVWIKTEAGDDFDGVLTGWDVSLLDTSAVGIYYPFFIVPPPGIGFPTGDGPGVEVMGAEVYVMDPDEVYLFAMEYDPYDFGFLSLQWLKEISEPELWVSVDGGKWEPAADFEIDYAAEPSPRGYIDCDLGSDRLTLKLGSDNSFFQAGHTYELQVRYENGGLSADNLIVDYTGGKPKFRVLDGDRNGGDRNPGGEETLPAKPPTKPNPATLAPGSPTNTSPPPRDNRSGSDGSSASNGPDGGRTDSLSPLSGGVLEDASMIQQTNAEVMPVAEQNTLLPPMRMQLSSERYSIVLTGAQFSALIKANTPHLLLMGEDGLQLWLPRSEALAFGEVNSFAMRLYMPTSDSVSVDFQINGSAFAGAFNEPFVIGIPWEQGEASAADETGAVVPCAYNQADRFLLLTLHKSGIYTITALEGTAAFSAVPVADEPASTAVPAPEPINEEGGVLPVAFAGIAVAGGAGTFAGVRLRGRKVKR